MPSWFIWIIFVIFLWGIGGFLGKISLHSGLDSHQVYFLEVIGALAVATCVTLLYHQRIFPIRFNPSGLLLGVSWGLGTVLFIVALSKGRASIVVPLSGLSPAVSIILAVIFLGEPLTLREIIGILFALVASALLSF